MSYIYKTYQPEWDMESGWSFIKVGPWEGHAPFDNIVLDGGRHLLAIPEEAIDALEVKEEHDMQDATEEEIALLPAPEISTPEPAE